MCCNLETIATPDRQRVIAQPAPQRCDSPMTAAPRAMKSSLPRVGPVTPQLPAADRSPATDEAVRRRWEQLRRLRWKAVERDVPLESALTTVHRTKRRTPTIRSSRKLPTRRQSPATALGPPRDPERPSPPRGATATAAPPRRRARSAPAARPRRPTASSAPASSRRQPATTPCRAPCAGSRRRRESRRRALFDQIR